MWIGTPKSFSKNDRSRYFFLVFGSESLLDCENAADNAQQAKDSSKYEYDDVYEDGVVLRVIGIDKNPKRTATFSYIRGSCAVAFVFLTINGVFEIRFTRRIL